MSVPEIGHNADTCEWFGVAVALDLENRELRRWLTSLFFYIAEREEILECARAAIDRRWPTSTRKAA